MSLRKITLLVVGLTFIGLVAFLTFALETSLLRHFIEVEEQMVHISVQRAVGAINGDFDHLLATAADWSDRGEIVRFLQQPDDSFISQYLTERTFSDINANVLVLTNAGGDIVFGKGFSFMSQREETLPRTLIEIATTQHRLMDSSPSGISGFLQTENGPLMLAMHPIGVNQGGKERIGTMLVGRYLTQSETLRLSGIIQMPITIEPYNNPNLKPDFLAAKQLIGESDAFVAIPLDEDQIGGYAVLKDIDGNPAYLLNIQQRRVIYQNSQLLMRYLIFALLAAGMVFGITSLYVLEALVLSRMSRLSREVNDIGTSGALARRVNVDRQDELSSLSENINHMLSKLQQTQQTEAALQQSLSQRLEEQKALYESSQVFLSRLDKVVNLRNICDLAVKRFNLEKVRILELDDKKKALVTVAACGCDHGEPDDCVFIEDPKLQTSPIIQAYLTKATRISISPLSEFQATAVFPLVHDGILFAEILLYSRDAEFFSPARMTTLQSFANLSGMAIKNAGLFEQVRMGQERMEALSKRLVEVQEEERKYIAMELHDEIGQLLTGLRLLLNVNLSFADEKTRERLQQSKDVVNELIVRIRQMSLELRPGLLDDLGLLPALLWHFEGYTHTTGIRVNFHHENLEGKRFSSNIETTAYRVIQEALTNVARHANVAEITVSTGVHEHALNIQIKDQGVGFDTSELNANGKSRGLMGMRERVKFVGGTAEIRSSKGSGTTIDIRIPLEAGIEEETP
ncbi:MAG TPA: CHASE4 domain-containing protein [Levilinea sp.]|nr:CHASE4 domain-containing protein [Levilinea sp.]